MATNIKATVNIKVGMGMLLSIPGSGKKVRSSTLSAADGNNVFSFEDKGTQFKIESIVDDDGTDIEFKCTVAKHQ